MRLPSRISQKLLFFFIVVTLVPVLLVSTLNALNTRRLIESEVQARQFEITKQIAEQIRLFVNDIEGQLDRIGRVALLTPNDIQLTLEEFSKNRELFSTIVLIDPNGRELTRVDNGVTISPQPYQWTSDEVFFRPLRGERYYSTVRFAAEIPRLDISLPIYDAERIVGVIVAQINLVEPWDVVRSQIIGHSGYAVLLDRRANIIAYRNFPEYRNISLIDTPPIQQMLAGRSESEVLDYTSPIQGRVLGSAVRIDGPNWILLTERSVDDAYQAYAEANLSVVIGIVLALLLSLPLAYIVSRQVTQPVLQLHAAAQRITAGDLDARSNLENRDEIGELGQAFNVMAASLRQRIYEIDEKNKALHLATQEAQESSRLKDEFMAVMSHELRTPLNAIMGYTGIVLMDGNLHAEQVRMLQRVEANSTRLLNLINDILDLSRVEAGRMPITPQPVKVRDLFHRLADQLIILKDKTDVVYSLEIADSVPPVIKLDEDSLVKIMTNLLSNAFKFTERGRVEVFVEAEANMLKIEVRDTGIGIPAHMHEIIFDRFRQVDGSATRQYGGTGLGLSIVRRICETLGGNIGLKSVLDQGSTFIVTLPYQDEKDCE